jgi:hypothetical protein
VIVCGRAAYYRRDVLAFTERELNVQAESAPRRLVGYYRAVTLNGAFYGVMRREQLLQHPLPDGMGGDWLLVAQLAYLGKIRTLRSTAIHRSLAGSSRDAATLAELHGTRRPRGGNWQLAVARSAFCDVRSASAYSELSSVRRLLLGFQAYVLVVSRFSFKTWLGAGLEKLGLFDRSRRLLEWRRRRFERR